MLFPTYHPSELEPAILTYWQKQKIVEKLRQKSKKKEKFYFLEGPPYTSGRIHLGHAWNMGLKDILLRYKRMQGFNVWDRMGYDMHGLPTEQKVMAKFGLKNKEDILNYGLKKFTQECEIFCKEMMQTMNQNFIRLGSTLDFTNPYQPISREFMEGEWWLIKTAYEKGRVYQGLRTMHWDAATQTAVAKHELEYKTITDDSIFVKFPHASRKNTFFIVWTTTPWTIPLNLGIMVSPKLLYAEVTVVSAENRAADDRERERETWIVGKDLLPSLMEKVKASSFSIIKEYLGKMLEGQRYEHPLGTRKLLPPELQKNKKLFTVLLSEEYVDASSGTGLVHCAPGCGPEDYEVGHRNGIPPFNSVDESGSFLDFGPFTGMQAKLDDKLFTKMIDEAGALLAKEAYRHDYPHGERSHAPVIFRTTKQWFFKVEDLREKMLAANKDIFWHPQAGRNAYTSWLENLRDNSITKQRYWGTPVPIWQAQDGEVIVVGSVAELEKLSGKKVRQLHIPMIDDITIEKNGKIYRRIPDVLDVWIDAGSASWNCLDYPAQEKRWKEFFPADFILEGKDQIRGWFNLLMVASFLVFDKPSFKAVYMHGFINDVSGVKMSKSLGNIIAPDELIQKHGADTLRYYMCQTKAGEDINFSWEECAAKERQLHILWNLHKLLLSWIEETGFHPSLINPETLEFGIEEQYIFSKLHTTIQQVTRLLEEYRLDETIAPLEELYLELSRTYVQLVREKMALGDLPEKEACVYVLGTVLLEFLKMFQCIAPFICEAVYLNLRDILKLRPLSISHFPWPTVNPKLQNPELERDMALAQEVLTAAAAAREKVKLGLRWPVKEILIETSSADLQAMVPRMQELLLRQANAKAIRCVSRFPGMNVKVKPNYGKIGPVYGSLSSSIIARLTIDSPETILQHIQNEGAYIFSVERKEVRITKEMILVEREVPPGLALGLGRSVVVAVDTERSPALEGEGFAREISRQIQELRKKAGLQKTDRIHLALQADSSSLQEALHPFQKELQERVGAEKFIWGRPQQAFPHQATFAVKKESFTAWFELLA